MIPKIVFDKYCAVNAYVVQEDWQAPSGEIFRCAAFASGALEPDVLYNGYQVAQYSPFGPKYIPDVQIEAAIMARRKV